MKISEGDLVYIIFDKRRKYIKMVESGKEFHSDRGYVRYKDLIGKEFGITVKTEPYGHKAFILKPLPSDIIMKMGRASQIIYPEDIGLILMYTGISPGYNVLEAGCGSGSLTSMMALHVQPMGHIYSYDIREKAIKQARKNLKKIGVADYATIELRDIVREELSHRDMDVVMLDLATPWLVIPKAYKYLKKSGVLCSFSPVIEQVKKTHEAMRKSGFYEIETYELIKRQIQVKKSMNATRPMSRMVGHTGYLTFGRKIVIKYKGKIPKKPEKEEYVDMFIDFKLYKENDDENSQ
ncbi:MAG: methyltransferase domain-containing protein [Candidatus Lokiarchaeota archaeon]|nr:methyltransferase domain-containing protein [Candidatus Lokiarchaeota archaeon]